MQSVTKGQQGEGGVGGRRGQPLDLDPFVPRHDGLRAGRKGRERGKNLKGRGGERWRAYCFHGKLM